MARPTGQTRLLRAWRQNLLRIWWEIWPIHHLNNPKMGQPLDSSRPWRNPSWTPRPSLYKRSYRQKMMKSIRRKVRTLSRKGRIRSWVQVKTGPSKTHSEESTKAQTQTWIHPNHFHQYRNSHSTKMVAYHYQIWWILETSKISRFRRRVIRFQIKGH